MLIITVQMEKDRTFSSEAAVTRGAVQTFNPKEESVTVIIDENKIEYWASSGELYARKIDDGCGKEE